MKLRFALFAILLTPALLAGCAQKTLFADNDPAENKLKYWNNDSAVQSAKNREQAAEWGFGFPNGSGFQ